MCATLLKALSKMHYEMCSRVHSKIFVTFASLEWIFNDILQQWENSKHLNYDDEFHFVGLILCKYIGDKWYNNRLLFLKQMHIPNAYRSTNDFLINEPHLNHGWDVYLQTIIVILGLIFQLIDIITGTTLFTIEKEFYAFEWISIHTVIFSNTFSNLFSELVSVLLHPLASTFQIPNTVSIENYFRMRI